MKINYPYILNFKGEDKELSIKYATCGFERCADIFLRIGKEKKFIRIEKQVFIMLNDYINNLSDEINYLTFEELNKKLNFINEVNDDYCKYHYNKR